MPSQHVPGPALWYYTSPVPEDGRVHGPASSDPGNLTTVLPALCAPAGSPGPLQCYSVGPLGILNCSWEPLGDLETPPVLYHQSQKYHPNRTKEVKVPSRQSWVTIPRKQFTTADELLIWGTQEGQLLWPPVSVNLKTQSNTVWGGEA